MIRILLCTLLGCMAWGMVHAQTIVIKDQEILQPIEMVTLSSEDPKVSAITNVKGEVDITPFKGAEKISLQYLGYTTRSLSYEQLMADGPEIFMVQNDISLEHVVVSASRWEETQQNVPNKISVISKKTVALQNPQTTADLLAASGEVFIQKSQQGGGSPMIRGFATNRLLMTIDGVRMNTAIFRSGNIQNVLSIDAFATERTEVLFGPGSVMYGSDAIAGVMNFYTLKAKLSTTDKAYVTGSGVARYSSANSEMTGHFDVSVGWKKFALLSSVSYSKFGDLQMGSYGPDEYLRNEYVARVDSVDKIFANKNPKLQRSSGYSQINMMQKVRFRPNDKWDMNYTFQYSTTSSYDRYDRNLRYRNGALRYGEWYYGPQEWLMNLLSVTHTGNNALYDQMNIRVAQQLFRESRHDRSLNDNIRANRYEEVFAYSFNADFTKKLGLQHHLYYGLEAIVNDVNSKGTDEDILTGAIVNGPARYPQSMWQSYSAYLTYQYKPIEKVTISAGLRYSYFLLNAEFDTTFYPFPYTDAKLNSGAVTGSAGLVYNPTPKWALSLNLSTGFRSPNVDDLGKVFDSEPGAVVVPNRDLKAEYAYNFEVGIAKVFADYLEVDVTGFYTILDNALVRRDFSLGGLDSIVYDGELSKVQAIQNSASAKVWGVQAGFKLKLPKGFGVTSRVNYQSGSEEQDNGDISPLRHAAPLFGVSHVTFDAWRVKLDMYAMYSAKVAFEDMPDGEISKTEIYAVDDNGNPYSPAWYTLNFKASYRITDLIAVNVGVENITDVRYRPYSSGLVAPGRNFILSLRADF